MILKIKLNHEQQRLSSAFNITEARFVLLTEQVDNLATDESHNTKTEIIEAICLSQDTDLNDKIFQIVYFTEQATKAKLLGGLGLLGGILGGLGE